MVVYRLAQLGRFIVNRIPVCFAYPVAELTGDMIYYGWGRARRNMNKSVASLLQRETNDPEVRKTARRCMGHFVKYIVEMLRYPHPDEDFFQKHFQLKGREYLDAALREGKGAILVSFHLGNLDLGIRLLGSLGYPINAIVDSLGWSGQLDAFLQKPRAHNGVKLINAKDASSHILEVLRHNEVLALMIDCPNFGKGVRVKLGKNWAIMPTGAATLALRTGAPLIPCGLVRTSNTTFQGIIGQPVEYEASGKLEADIKELTQRTAQSMEEMVLSFIDQWYIFHHFIQDEVQETEETSDEDPALYPAN
jgi:lauroyl/myristoyl acyltransferase